VLCRSLTKGLGSIQREAIIATAGGRSTLTTTAEKPRRARAGTQAAEGSGEAGGGGRPCQDRIPLSELAAVYLNLRNRGEGVIAKAASTYQKVWRYMKRAVGWAFVSSMNFDTAGE